MKIKKLFAVFIATALLASIFPAYVFAETAIQIWVDGVNGDDANGGYDINDAFATIGRAKAEAALTNSDMSSDIEIIIRGGKYNINVSERDYNIYEYVYNDDKTIAQKNIYRTIKVKSSDLIFTGDDSGTNGYSVVYKAYNNETPEISGERVIDGWSIYDEERGIYTADANGIVTRSLYVNGKRAVRARSEFNVMNCISALSDVTKTAFGHTTSDLSMASWNNIKDVEFVYMDPKGWVAPRVKVESVSVSGNVLNITMQNPAWNILEYVWYRRDNYTFPNGPMYIENAYELLDSPGEWYLDTNKDKIYYMPYSGEVIENSIVTVPYAEELMCFEDAENIRFEGIKFCGTTYLRPDFGYIDAQSNGIRENPDGFEDETPISAVSLKHCDNVIFSKCRFERLGSNAVNILEGCKNIDLTGCKLDDISGTAVVVGGVSSEYRNIADIANVISDIDIVNNEISNAAVDFVSGVGISVGMAGNVNIRNNEISNLNYSGMHIGWGIYSDFEETSAQNFGLLKNICIENNLIYDTNILMRDGAPIYVRGKTGADLSSPNLIIGNYIKSTQVNGCAIYFDCGVGNWLAENNVCEDCDYIFSGQAFKDYHIGEGNYLLTPKDVVVLDTYKAYSSIEKIIKVENHQWSDTAKTIMSNAGIENKTIECFSLHNKNGMTVNMTPGQIIDLDLEIYGSNGTKTATDTEVAYYEATYLNGKVYERYMLENKLLKPLENSEEIKIISDGRFQILKPGKRAILAAAKTDNTVLLRHIDIICGENVEASENEYSFVPQNEQYSYITESVEWPEYHIPRFNNGGGYIEYILPASTEKGNYELWFTQIGNEQISWYNAINKGIFQFSIDGVNVGEPVDFHSMTKTNIYIGKYYYDGKSEIKLRLTNVGKNEDSSDYRVSIDSFFFNKMPDEYVENSGIAERIKLTGKTGFTSGRMSVVAKNNSGNIVFADQIQCSDNGFSTDFGVIREGLSENEELDITISSLDREKPYRNSFKINRHTINGLRISEFSITDSNGIEVNEIDDSTVVCISISLENTTENTEKAMLVGAIYDKEGKLIDVDMHSAVEITDEVKLNVNIPTDCSTDILKIMILDDKQNIAPLYEAENYQVNSENIFISIY